MRYLIIAGILTVAFASCGGQNAAFVDETTGMDPYCENVEEWREKLDVSATLTEDGEISLLLDVGEGLVELTGEVAITGAVVSFVHYDVTSLWYVLIPEEGVTEMVIQGVLVCTAAEEHYTVEILLTEDGEISHTLEFGVLDAGVEVDGGV